MPSLRNGKSTHPVKVGPLSSRGFWLVLGDRKLFLSFARFPWFREFTVRELADVRRPAPHHLRWPAFDIDLHVDSILHPERYPLRERRLMGDAPAVVAQLRRERDRKARPSVSPA